MGAPFGHRPAPEPDVVSGSGDGPSTNPSLPSWFAGALVAVDIVVLPPAFGRASFCAPEPPEDKALIGPATISRPTPRRARPPYSAPSADLLADLDRPLHVGMDEAGVLV